jgi:hypothetical protein
MVEPRKAKPEKRQRSAMRELPKVSEFRGESRPVLELQRMIGNRRVGRLFQIKQSPQENASTRDTHKHVTGATQNAGQVQLAHLGTTSAPWMAGAHRNASDALEQEAERTAEQVNWMTRFAARTSPQTETIPRDAQRSSSPPAAVPPIVHHALTSPSQTLDAQTRDFMEARLARDFSEVRLHTGPEAAESAAALGAQAFTVGNRIVFGSDKFAPDSDSGRRLLAHELTHVAQQADGRAADRIQASPEQPKLRPKQAPKPRPFWVRVDREMDADELLHEFVRQYYNESNEKEIQKKLPLWRWQNGSGRRVTKADVAKHGVVLMVTDYSQLQMVGMSAEEQKRINEETNKRFWEETGYKPGENLGSSPEDQEMARKWIGIRTDIIIDEQKVREIDALPADIKAILFGGSRKVSPDEYDTILAIAAKLSKLTPAERQDYLSKVNFGTNSWSDLDASIDRYILQGEVRDAEEEKTEGAAAELFGLEDLYLLYRARQAAWVKSAQATKRGGYSPLLLQQAQDADRKFMVALQQNNFSSEREFTDALETYRLRFRAEAVNLALEMLARFEHMLYMERIKFQDPANAAALVNSIAATQASAHYAAANKKFSTARAVRMTADPDDTSDLLQTGLEAAKLEEEGRQIRAEAEGEVFEASGKDPLVDPERAGRGTDREKLAGLDAAGAQRYMLEVIEERQADANKARREFTDDPERIFSIADLVKATQQTLGIADDTIYVWIIRDYIADQRALHLFSTIVQTILALVLAFLVPGGGWVAAAAMIASAGMSAYQAYEAIKEYRTEEAEYNLGFIDEDPSLFWVGVAVVGAAIDLGIPAAQLFKKSAVALKELEVPLKEIGAARDAETAAARLETLNAKIDSVQDLLPEVREALKARAAAEIGFKKALGEASGSLRGVLPGAVDPATYRLVYYSIRKGVTKISLLRKEARIMELVTNPASRKELKLSFDQMKKVVKLGADRGMDEATVLKYVDRVAAESAGDEGAFKSIMEEMKNWRKPTAEQIRAERELEKAHEELASLRRTKEELEAELSAGPKTPEGKPDQQRIDELRENLKGLQATRIDPATGKRISVEGHEIVAAEEAVRAAELTAERARLDPKEIMRRAFGGSKERAEIIAGATKDGVGPLKTPAQKLTVDHIISIKQISDMKGFDKLTVPERNLLATRADNLIVMDSSANFSKGERSWATWRQYSTFYEDATRDAMVARAAELRTRIEVWIAERVKGR